MKLSPAKSRKRTADAAAAGPPAPIASGSAAKAPPAKKARASEDKGPDKYCHFCQHAKQTMMACASPGCNHRYCVYCLDLHLGEQPAAPGSKTWLCPTCRGSCCCCSEDGTCDKAHRHCKAFRYRARRALNAASKRASGPAKLGQAHATKRAQAAASRAPAPPAAAPRVAAQKVRVVEEFKPNDAMLALLELAQERLSDEGEEEEADDASSADEPDASSADGTSSEGEEASASRHTTPERMYVGAEAPAGTTDWAHLRAAARRWEDEEAALPASPAARGAPGTHLDALLATVQGSAAMEAPPAWRGEATAPPPPSGLGPLEIGVASMHTALMSQQHIRLLPTGAGVGGAFRPPPLGSLLDVMRSLQQQQHCQG